MKISYLQYSNKKKKGSKSSKPSPEDSIHSVKLVNGNLRHWKGLITGPSDSPFVGGIFQIDIKIPEKYPYIPPKMQFDTKIWHPNISSQTGAICLDILKDEWSPALTIRTALLSIAAMLTSAEPKSPQDAVVAAQYENDINGYNKKAIEWTKLYANEHSLHEEKIQKILDMGFSRSSAEVSN